MCLLFETIACIDGKLLNLFWHSARVNTSRSLLFKSKDKLILETIHLPNFVHKGTWKCRVLYDEKINGVSFEPYHTRKIKTFTLVDSTLEYSHKYHDRDELEALFNQKGEADEIIIIKNGLVTDTSIANILLFDGHYWTTPKNPLLKGTMLAELISKKAIKQEVVKVEDLANYNKIMLVNAMNPFDECRAINLAKVNPSFIKRNYRLNIKTPN